MSDNSKSKERLLSYLDRCVHKQQNYLNNEAVKLEDKYICKGQILTLKEIKKVVEEGKFDDILAKDE
ncbi:hypothetical protein [Paraclostridium bifermentans]|uniref:hypothetical protein n=1 Tax=Paraclostridium bifermentans TaxID=1490 RepID=UPI00374E41E0